MPVLGSLHAYVEDGPLWRRKVLLVGSSSAVRSTTTMIAKYLSLHVDCAESACAVHKIATVVEDHAKLASRQTGAKDSRGIAAPNIAEGPSAIQT